MSSFKLGSFSEPNVNITYVCLIGNITPANMSAADCESGRSRPSYHVVDNMDNEVGTSKDDEMTIEVQRSAAFHELIESNRKAERLENLEDPIKEVASKTILSPHTDDSEDDSNKYENPKILNLTKTKWLSESRDGSPDARNVNALTGAKVRRLKHYEEEFFEGLNNKIKSYTVSNRCTYCPKFHRKQEALLTPSTSDSSISEDLEAHNTAERVLSTVLALDKEHNLFGLSHMKIVGPQEWKKMHKQSESKAIFRHDSIVQVCLRRCCRRRSKSDLPASLKCGGCKSKCSCGRCGSCSGTNCSSCGTSCGTPCGTPCSTPCSTPCATPCGTPCARPCPRPCPTKKRPRLLKPCPPCPLLGCNPSACEADCTRFGLQMTVIRKPKYAPTYTELEPKSSCILSKPFAARSCHHVPRCMPPSSCFPFLMPCFWPARAGAPCSEPSRCFHNPPCPKGRSPRSQIAPEELCPVGQPCTGTEKSPAKCENYSCIGRNNEALKKALTEKYASKK